MLDNLKARQLLKKYIEKYDFSNPRIKLKAAHIYRVADVAKQIATELNLSKEQIDLAELIGLLHDIGRFEQLRIYDTFKDGESVNHADMGVKVLKENNFIQEFCNDEKYYDIIYTAILNHNKYKIQDELAYLQALHLKLFPLWVHLLFLSFYIMFQKFQTPKD